MSNIVEETSIPEGKKFCECGRCGELIFVFSKRGKPLRFKPGHNSRGETNCNWKGGIPMSKGYRVVRQPDHPGANSSGYVPEHIIILEQKIGRRLEDNEVSHHINGIKTDNRPENLQLVTRAEHWRIHKKKDMSKRFCCDCGGKTRIRKDRGTEEWMGTGIEGEFRCAKCYDRKRYAEGKRRKAK